MCVCVCWVECSRSVNWDKKEGMVARKLLNSHNWWCETGQMVTSKIDWYRSGFVSPSDLLENFFVLFTLFFRWLILITLHNVPCFFAHRKAAACYDWLLHRPPPTSPFWITKATTNSVSVTWKFTSNSLLTRYFPSDNPKRWYAVSDTYLSSAIQVTRWSPFVDLFISIKLMK